MSTFLPIITECDNFRPRKDDDLALFYLSLSVPAQERQLIGILRPQVVELLNAYNTQRAEPAFEMGLSASGKKAVAFSASIDTPDKRSAVMHELGHRWRDDGLFADVIGGRMWRNELYAVRASPFLGWSPTAPPAFVMERVVCALFGVVTYGVHLTAYTPDYRFWVPRRSKTKQTFVVLLRQNDYYL